MKLAALGNSHIGSLKRAWDRMAAEFAEHEVVFFGARGVILQFLRVEGRKLVPTSASTTLAIKFTSGGRSDIDLSEFDAVLIYGCDARPFIMPGGFYSKQAINRTMTDLASGLFFQLLQMVRQVSTELPIYVGHEPLLAVERTEGDQSRDAYVQGLALFNKTIFEPLGARMIAQPLETIVNGNRTEIKYSHGSKRLAIGDRADDEPHPERDLFHMNDDFGELWLRKFFAETKAPQAAAAPAKTGFAGFPSLRPKLKEWLR